MNGWRGYAFAALMVAAATAFGEFLENSLHIGRMPSTLFLPAVLLATVMAGSGPGLFATVLGPLVSEFAIPHDHRTFSGVGQEVVGLLLYAAVGAAVAVLAARLKNARALAEAAAGEATRRSDELVAARHEAEQLARDARRRASDFATLFEEAPIGIGISEDVDCRRVVPNRALAEMLGVPVGRDISPSDAIGDGSPLRMTTPDGAPVPAEEMALQRAARTGQAVRAVDVDIVRADGGQISLLEFAAPIFDDDGRPRGAIGAFLDVTSRRRSSEEQRFLAEATRVLNNTLDYQDTLAQLVQLAVPRQADCSLLDVLTPEGHVVRVGVAHRDPARETSLREALVSAPTERAIGGHRGLLDLVRAGKSVLWSDITPEFIAAHGLDDHEVAAVLSVDLRSCAIVPLLLRDRVIGAFAWARHAGRPSFDDRDVELAEEVARRASVAVENALLYREAQTANRLKDEFVATLSHELRTPLNALLGWTELLMSGHLPAERQQLAIEAIDRTARLQAQITDDLVNVSQAASGAFRLAPRQVAAGEVVRSAAEAFRLAAESKGVRLDVDVADDMPAVYVDPDRLQQIVFNLVANAVKFTPEGTVAVQARIADGRLEVRVRDTGIGIAAGFLPFVFDRFRQADGSISRQYGGLGLGLSIVRSLVELHGGRVSAHSEGEGRGATFTVWLPATAPVAPAAASPTAHAAGPDGRP